MPINNGYDKFYSMCSVVDKIQDSAKELRNCAFRAQVPSKYKKGDSLLYTNDEGATTPVNFDKCIFSKNALKYVVIDKEEETIFTFQPNLRHKDDIDISIIPITPTQYKVSLDSITDDELNHITQPQPLDPLAQLWLSYHCGIMKHSPKNGMI